jgi:Domain of unknown function (DUF1844)
MDGTERAQAGSERGMTFESLVVLFGTAGLVHLGAAPDPAGGERRVDLDQAKQTIEVLEVLKDKTVGNLSTSEAGLLDGILFDLRCRYVEAMQKR